MVQDNSIHLLQHDVEPRLQPTHHIYVIDDDSDVRKSLHFRLMASSITVWPFGDAGDFLDQIGGLNPAPILLDLLMPGIDGLQVLATLREREVQWPVIVMTAHGDVPIAVRAMKLGAIEFLEKPFPVGTLDRALDHAFRLLDSVVRSGSARAEARRLVDLLTPRKLEILTILTTGMQNKVVANRLGISVRTVEMHRSNALAKISLKSIAEVLALLRAAELHAPP